MPPDSVFGLDFNLLRFFAEKGKSKKVISSTSIISKRLRVSQQTVSRKLKELSKKGFIDCKTSSKGIEVFLTDKGWNVLNSAYFYLKPLFEKNKKLKKSFSGKIVSGLGEGKYYLSFRQYSLQIDEKLGFVPFEGTLNLEGNFSEVFSLLEGKWIEISGFETKHRSFGKIFCHPAKINGKIFGAIVFPERGIRDEKVVELVAPLNLRKKLGLKNGSQISFSIE